MQAYDTSTLPPNSIIKVLQDESRNNETTYYRWVITGGVGAWSLIGEEGPYYTISAADAKFATQTALNTGLTAKQNTLISGTNIKTVNNQSLLGSGDLNITASVLWGGIGGTLSNQTDLQNALNTKQDVINDLSTIRNGAAAGATAVQPAALANYVDTSTDQTIGGVKTFTNDTIVIKNTSYAYSETPAANQYSQWRWTDKNDNWISQFYSALYANGSARTAMSLKNKSGSSALLGLLYNGSGEFYTEAPTPTDTTTTSGTQIATTGWVNATGNNVVHLTDNETIAGTKTFTAVPIVYADNPYIVFASSNITKGTNPSSTVSGVIALTGSNKSTASAASLARLWLNVTADGTTCAELRAYKNESGSTAAKFSVYYPTSGSAYVETTAYLRPSSDNSLNLGYTNYRWKQLYAGTTTISTSDERLKQGIESVPDAVLDAWGEVEFYRYKFNDSVAEKGFDNARYHTGMVAQRIENTFRAHGLNAFDYGLLCFDEWAAEPEVRDEENEIIKPAVAAGNRYSLRYEECLCMEAAYQRRRADRIEARLAALEARL